jgi:uncharacterized protein YqgC (DUF456 family)
MTSKTGAVRFANLVTVAGLVNGFFLPIFYIGAAGMIVGKQVSNYACELSNESLKQARSWQDSIQQDILARSQAAVAFSPRKPVQAANGLS